MFTSAILAVALASGEPWPHFDYVAPEVAAQRVSSCGLGPVTLRFNELLQSETLIAKSVSTASDKVLECVDRNAIIYDVELAPELQARFEFIRKNRFSASLKAGARDWLGKRALLDRVPTYSKGVTDDETFARQAEELCGPSAIGALHSPQGPHAFSVEWMARAFNIESDNEAFICLSSVATLAGFELGFIGNEAYSTESQASEETK